MTRTESDLQPMTIEKVAGMLWQALNGTDALGSSGERRSAALSAAWEWMHDNVPDFLDAIPSYPFGLDEWIAQTQREADHD